MIGNVIFFQWTTNITKTLQSSCINTKNSYCQIDFEAALTKYFLMGNVIFFQWTTNITKTPQSSCINTNNTCFQIDFEAAFIKMLWAKKCSSLGSSPPLFILGSHCFPIFTRQLMKQNFTWSTRAIIESICWLLNPSRLGFWFAKNSNINLILIIIPAVSLLKFFCSSKLWSIKLRSMCN